MRRPAVFVVLVLLLVSAFGASSARAYPVDFRDTQVASGLVLPIALVCVPDGRMFVGEIGGTIRLVKNGVVSPKPMTQLSVENFEEQGLLGMALHPDFPNRPYLYVLYTPLTGHPKNNTHRISQFTVAGDTLISGREIILHSTLPTGEGYHVGGCLRFGPDGRLYASVGENGYNGTKDYPQQLSRLEGKIIRINIDGSIPPSNPFYSTAGAKREIFERGLRNPFRFTFQPGTGLMFINDVGPNTSTSEDEINVGSAGTNFGFPTVLGTVIPPPAGMTNPIHSTIVGSGACETGGVFYNGLRFPPEYQNSYFWFDHSRGQIHRMVLGTGNSIVSVTKPWGLTATTGWGYGPVDLELGFDGSLYYTSYDPGSIRKIEYTFTGTAGATPPPLGAGTRLEVNSPNPFALATQIPFTLALAGRARLEVYDVSGRLVAVLSDETLPAGPHSVSWTGRDQSGARVPPGVYLLRLEASGLSLTRRVALIR